MIAKVYSAIPQGYNGSIVEVEGDINQGLPSFNLVGMANKTISEARERVRSAISNSDLSFPTKKVTINLAPAELTKDGSHLDLPIALAVLTLSKQLLQDNLSPSSLFVGELSLDGHTKPIRGIINIVETAKIHGYQEVYVPYQNLSQASLIDNIRVIGVSHLRELFLHLKGLQFIPAASTNKFCIQSPNDLYKNSVVKNNYTELESSQNSPVVNSTLPDQPQSTTPTIVKITQTSKPSLSSAPFPTLDQVRGQSLAKRALSIAVAGQHNLLLTGPPGSGKTLLAHVAANLLPGPSRSEQIEITKLHALVSSSNTIVDQRPFRSPHHTASSSAIIGGGPHALPGEISLAHRGILFLDELPEFQRNVLESLRQPLEDGTISISRAEARFSYPAAFMFIATMNPCPCGYLGDPDHPCTCTIQQIQAYQKRISGPILDRIDLIVHVDRVPSSDLLLSRHVKNTETDRTRPISPTHDSSTLNVVKINNTSSEHNVVKIKITRAIQRQFARYGRPNLFNSRLNSQEIQSNLNLKPEALSFLQTASEKLKLTARSYFKVLKVAQTIADFDNVTEVGIEQISEALSFRQHSP